MMLNDLAALLSGEPAVNWRVVRELGDYGETACAIFLCCPCGNPTLITASTTYATAALAPHTFFTLICPLCRRHFYAIWDRDGEIQLYQDGLPPQMFDDQWWREFYRC